VLNWLGVRNLVVYLLLGVVLWYFMLMSGIHATLAGVLLALAIPFKIRYTPPTLIKLLQERLHLIQADITPEAVDARVVSEELEDLADAVSSPAQKLEQRLHSVVALGIIPLFAFANTSLVIDPAALGQLLSPLSIGIFLGLVVGKPVGIGGMAWLATRLGLAQRPEGVTWRHIWGAGLLGGIGFTMSIFVTLLALGEHSTEDDVAKMAVLLASLVAGLSGYWLLRTAPMPPPSVP
jgi:NhaA family Na+:H+ antiporter